MTATSTLFCYLLNQRLNVKTNQHFKLALAKILKCARFYSVSKWPSQIDFNNYPCMSDCPAKCTHLYALSIKNILPWIIVVTLLFCSSEIHI